MLIISAAYQIGIVPTPVMKAAPSSAALDLLDTILAVSLAVLHNTPQSRWYEEACPPQIWADLAPRARSFF